MKKVIQLACCIPLFLIFSLASADQHRNRERHGAKNIPPVNNETYKQECGACHFAYQPWLLPSGSWAKLVAQLPSHFGEGIEIDAESTKVIEGYLRSNAVEHSDVKRSRKRSNTAGNSLPLRITETPYFRQKHHELDPSIFDRKSIGAPSNCIPCHTTAEQGVYDDDFVKIPE